VRTATYTNDDRLSISLFLGYRPYRRLLCKRDNGRLLLRSRPRSRLTSSEIEFPKKFSDVDSVFPVVSSTVHPDFHLSISSCHDIANGETH
jgi:hypothetical protein